MEATVSLNAAELREAVALWVQRKLCGRIVGEVRVTCPGQPDPPYAAPVGHGVSVTVELPPATWCGMSSHPFDCTCGGMGGDR